MRHLRTFVLSEGAKYQRLEPKVELLSPNKSEVKGFSGWDGCVGWAYCSRTTGKDLFLLYFEKYCRRAALSGALPNAKYKACWFNPCNGDWIDASGALTADAEGKIALPDFPDNMPTSDSDWALKLKLMKG